jgi:hypothetical protein
LATLAFDGRMPDIEALGRTWRTMLREAEDIAARLPEDHVGTCVLTRNGELPSLTGDALTSALNSNAIVFHEGCVRGAWPRLRRDS